MTQEPVASASRPQSARPVQQPPASRRGGGYYLDDGPGDGPPVDLASIPDADPRAEPLHRYANNPYVVFGRTYVPQRDVQPFRQRGVGSWYGRKFHGQKTATGETYDMYAMSAAHPTLPLPSYARVTNVANGRSVVVRVNDRGPFLHGRAIDLSYTAAWKLGYVDQGSAQVELETIVAGTMVATTARRPTLGEVATAEPRVVPPAATLAPTTVAATSLPGASAPSAAATASGAPSDATLPPLAVDGNGVFLQLGAFSGRDNAEAFRSHVLRMLPWLAEPMVLRPREGLVRVHLGPYRDPIEALAVAERIRDALAVRPVLTR